MVCKLGNVEQVTDQLTHHLTGVVLTVIGKGQLFIVFEEFLTHIPLHLSAHDMSLTADIIFTERLKNKLWMTYIIKSPIAIHGSACRIIALS